MNILRIFDIVLALLSPSIALRGRLAWIGVSLLVALSLSGQAGAQTAPPVVPESGPVTSPAAPKAQLSFKETSMDFGDIEQGDKVSHTFTFTNTGQAPLVIANVQTTCGCTASEWTRTPVAPGATGTVKATFDSKGKMGRQNKVITVYSNGVNPEERVSLVVNVLQPGSVSGDDQRTRNPQNR